MPRRGGGDSRFIRILLPCSGQPGLLALSFSRRWEKSPSVTDRVIHLFTNSIIIQQIFIEHPPHVYVNVCVPPQIHIHMLKF